MWGVERYEIASMLPIETIVSRAREAGATGWMSGLRYDGNPVGGRVSERRLVLRARRNGVSTRARNDFRPVLTARFAPGSPGTFVRVRIGIPRGTLAFMAVWMAIPTAIGIGTLIGGEPRGGLVLLLPLFGAGMMALGSIGSADAIALLRSTMTWICSDPSLPAWADGSPLHRPGFPGDPTKGRPR